MRAPTFDSDRPADGDARLRALIDQVPAAAVYREGDRLVANATALRLTGYVAERFPSVAEWSSLLTAEGDLIEIVQPGGEPRWLEFTTAPWEDGEVWVLHDVTARHQDMLGHDADTALLEAFRGAFAAAPIGMAITTTEGRYLNVNAALCAITGYSEEQLIGWNWLALTHPQDRPSADGRLRAGATRPHGWRSEKRYVHADGQTVWVAVSATPVRSGDGQSLGLLSMVQDITERRRYEGELRRLAEQDSLTGLLNRRRFTDEIARQHTYVDRYGPAGALLMLDLDSFKPINDQLGHAAGDGLLVDVAHALNDQLRDTDVIARLGGDEFAVILPQAGSADAQVVAAAVVDAVRDCATDTDAGRLFQPTAGVGVAQFDGGRDELHRADLAMYAAKAAGGDRWAAAPT